MATDKLVSQQHFLGVLLVVISTIGWSLAGIFTSEIEGDVWAILFWRSMASGSVVFFYVWFRRRGKSLSLLRQMGGPGWIFAFICSGSALCFITAFKHNSVANVAAIYALVPVFAAWFGWLFLREQISSKTVSLSFLSLCGTAVIFSESLKSGHYFGDLLALIMTLSEAFLIMLARKYAHCPMVFAGAVSSLLLAVCALLLSDEILLSELDILFGLAFGVSHALAIITLIEGAKLIPVISTALISGLEVPLAAGLAWLLLGQVPQNTTILGGSIIIAALFAYIYSANYKLLSNGNPIKLIFSNGMFSKNIGSVNILLIGVLICVLIAI